MKNSNSILTRIVALVLCLLTVFTIAGPAFALSEPEHEMRFISPDGDYTISFTKINATANLKTYKVNVSYTCNYVTTKIAGTVKVSLSSPATSYIFNQSFNVNVDATTGSGSFTFTTPFNVLASTNTVYLSTVSMRVYSGAAGWVYLNNINYAARSI